MSGCIHTEVGCFDWCHPSRKDFLIRITLPDDAPAKHLSATWPVDKSPDIDSDDPPSKVVEIISTRIESYFLCSSRTEDRKTIGWCRANRTRLDREWATAEIAFCQKRIERTKRRIEELTTEYLEPASDESDDDAK